MCRSTLIFLLSGLTFAGCAGHPPERGALPDESCLLRGPDVPPTDEYRVAVASTRLRVQRHDTLIEVDCTGQVRSGLADVPSGEGRRRVLTLRDGIQFKDGTPITAAEVARVWSGTIARGGGVDSVRALDDRRLEVFLERPTLTALASPDFSLDARDESGWRVVDQPGLDPRDGLATVDLMVVDDPALAEYAIERGMTAAPLPYDKTFVLLVPVARRASPLTSEARSDLAAAVRTASARASTTPAWWSEDVDGCGELSSLPGWRIPFPQRGVGAPCVYFDESDEVARDLAERIVALAAMDTAQSPAARAVVRALAPDTGSIPIARAVATVEMARRLENGEGFAFITSIRNPVADSCGGARNLLRRAPWLTAGGATLAATVVPMVDTRGYVILANRDVAVTWDIYGTVRVVRTPEQP